MTVKHSRNTSSLGLLMTCAGLVSLTLPNLVHAQFFNRSGQNQQAAQERRIKEAAEQGFVIEKVHGPTEALRQSRAMSAALARVLPERHNVVDAYVLVIGFDNDGVFGREAAETAKVLSRRYDAAGRTILLANGTGANDTNVPEASPEHLSVALGQLASVMNKEEDVLVLYVTAHGHWATGLAYKDGERANGNVAPARLATLLNEAGIKNRMVILSACFSGIFVPALQNETTVTMTAASSEKPSFGCRAENDWTFFGDALINNAMRQPKPIGEVFAQARALVTQWEVAGRLDPSNPQIDIGTNAVGWLDKLDAKTPKAATHPVGTPANAPSPVQRPKPKAF